ncbi:MAG: 30S ribosomal protein S12 methylthiotransferase RimO [Tannerella sp.]|jgi:ribosomal protein S12 methylthiotransferase|nr:30S ribosomal protein S12 methylthiotransferase RimO [Tannerella sp.]
MRKNKVDIITLGCSKNIVDSERLMRQFQANGFRVEHDPKKVNGEIVIVNTCGFIDEAKEESLNILLELESAKQSNRIGKLFVMGCLSERFATDLKKELPFVDRFYGKFNWKDVLQDVGKSYYADLSDERLLTTPKHYAWLKISEGCDRKCAYCSIPLMTGKYVSRPADEIVKEAQSLVKQGVKEIQVIAQDLTYYGIDLYRYAALPELIERLADIDGLAWIRLHYGYPANFPYNLLRVMRERENVCKYLDIALQHISDRMLTKMRRNITGAETHDFIARIRAEVPGIHLRTTFMTGHPGETDDDFEQLLEFVKEARFERMGAFVYSHEEGTYSYRHYSDDVPDSVKRQRLDRLMDIQQSISAEVNEDKVGKTFRVMLDRCEGDYFIGRTEYDSPEIDPEVLIERKENHSSTIGDFCNATIVKADAFELYAEPVF